MEELLLAGQPRPLSTELMEFLSGIPDPRRTDRGDFKYPLPDVMVMLCLGRLCGRVSRQDIISFTKEHLDTLQSRLGILEKGCPSEPTLCRLEKRIDPDIMVRLCEKTTSKWTDNYKGSGIAGCILTGMGRYADQTMFLPAAGIFSGTSHLQATFQGYYWSSTLHNASNGKYLGSAVGGSISPHSYNNRHCGFPVRAVFTFSERF